MNYWMAKLWVLYMDAYMCEWIDEWSRIPWSKKTENYKKGFEMGKARKYDGLSSKFWDFDEKGEQTTKLPGVMIMCQSQRYKKDRAL